VELQQRINGPNHFRRKTSGPSVDIRNTEWNRLKVALSGKQAGMVSGFNKAHAQKWARLTIRVPQRIPVGSFVV